LPCVMIYIACSHCCFVGVMDIRVTKVFRFHKHIFEELIHIISSLHIVMSDFRFFQYAQCHWHCNSQKTFQINFTYYHTESKNLSQVTNCNRYEFIGNQELEVCSMIMPSQKNIFLLLSAENLQLALGSIALLM
jgi:hypothetical protein